MSPRPIVLVTGASKGIGAATARLFAAEGHDVCLGFRSDEAGARAAAEACRAAGARTAIVRADVSDRADVAALFAECDRQLGPVACLVNSAGIIGGASPIATVTPEALDATFRANVFGTIWCLQEAVARMSTATGGGGGAIVNLSSVAATLGSPNEYVHYAASKGAVETLTIGAGKELAAQGIRVNAIRVGTTDTTMHATNGDPGRTARVAAITPMGRVADPSEIAQAALWLASPRAGFVTGTCLTVAGGLTA